MNFRSRNAESSFQEDIPDDEVRNSSKINLDRSTFLQLIKENPELYDVNHPNFNDRKSLDIVWSKISSQTGILGLFFSLECFELHKLLLFFLAFYLRDMFSTIKTNHRKKLLFREQKRLSEGNYVKFAGEDDMKFLEESAFVYKRNPSLIPSQRWEDKDVKQLLKLIEKYPVIYDKNHPNYTSYSAKNEAWAKINSQMNISGMFFIFLMISSRS